MPGEDGFRVHRDNPQVPEEKPEPKSDSNAISWPSVVIALGFFATVVLIIWICTSGHR